MRCDLRIARKAVFFLATLILLAIGSKPATAQSPDPKTQPAPNAQNQSASNAQNQQTPDIQQLNAKLQQLEQMMTEVKGQINAIEQRQARQDAARQAHLNAVTEENNGVSDSARLRSAVLSYSSYPAANAALKMPSGDDQADRKEPGTNMDIYGFAMLDSGYDFGQEDPDWADVLRPTKLPNVPNQFGPNGQIFFSVKQTRFGVKTSTATPLGDLKTIFEFELFGTGVDAGQTTFRLRHAWGELGHFGGGQTWSPFMDPNVFPNSIEYWGPNGMVFFRNVQFRWTPIPNPRNSFMVAAERPGASADQGIYAGRIELSDISPQFILPDLSMQAHFERSWGYFQIASLFRRIAWVDNAATPTNNYSGSAFGWGINASSNIKFGPNTTAKLQLVYGHAIQNYMNDAPIDIGVANNFSNPVSLVKGVPLPIIGPVAFVDHNWSPKFSSTIGGSMVNIWNSDAQSPTDFHQGYYALTNLLYYPIKNVMAGGEFQYGRRVNFRNGYNFNDYRLQFSVKYSYSKAFAF